MLAHDMAPTLLFVHGTGVRAKVYKETLDLIKAAVAKHLPRLRVAGCFWGESEGARLRANGKSIPGYDMAGGRPPTEADEMLAMWLVLYTDPWNELRLLRNLPKSPVAVGDEPPSVKLRQSVQQFEPSEPLADALRAANLRTQFDHALSALRAAPEFDQAAATARADPMEHRRAIGRALIAHACIEAEEAGQPPIHGALRDALVERVTDEFHGYDLGIGEFLLSPAKGLALRAVTRKLTGDRGAITDAAGPLAGDVLRFLARGEGCRDHIGQRIADEGPGPVYLLGHSLGGIMCVDLLIREAIPKVTALITVGSQASFLYEIGALPGLMHPDPLPAHFPTWLNIYDRRDVLSHVCEGVFGRHVTDVEVDNRQPFPQSHSAYWTNPTLWDAVRSIVG